MPDVSHALQRWTRKVGPGPAFQALAELIDQASDDETAVFAVDADKTIVYWSPGAERMLGWSAEEVVGQHCLKANRCPECLRSCGIAVHGDVDGAELVLLREDGVGVPVRKTARAFFDDEGTFLGGVEVLVPRRAGRDRPAAPVADWALDEPLALDGVVAFHGLLSRDPAMHQVFEIVRSVARTDSTVLVRGESGTGKELVARALHAESRRAGGPFLAINCATLSPNLLESELFGHVRGAFTGAVRDRPGLFRRADGGTLFLDEVAEVPLDLQARLLRVIQDQTFVPVGGSKEVQVDVRLVAATHRGLRERVRDGAFREDLMYRLRVVPVFLPPLRERPVDVELLLRHFVAHYNRLAGEGSRGRVLRRISPAAMSALTAHAWPGNVRELRNVVEHAFAIGNGTTLTLDELPPEFREPEGFRRRLRPDVLPSPDALPSPDTAPPAPRRTPPPPSEAEQRARILAALETTGGRVGEAAELLGMSRATFWRRRRDLGLLEEG